MSTPLRGIRAAKGRVDVDRLDSATEEDIESWKREDGVDDAALDLPRYVRVGPDVRVIRERLGLSQEAFAARYQLSLRTVQEWEQQRRVPEGPARVLLQVIEREPEATARPGPRTDVNGVIAGTCVDTRLNRC